MQRDPGQAVRLPQRLCHRGDQHLGTVADRYRAGQPLRAEDADRVCGEVGGDVGTGRIGQVVAERDRMRSRGGEVPMTTMLISGSKPTRCGTIASRAVGDPARTTMLGSGARAA